MKRNLFIALALLVAVALSALAIAEEPARTGEQDEALDFGLWDPDISTDDLEGLEFGDLEGLVLDDLELEESQAPCSEVNVLAEFVEAPDEDAAPAEDETPDAQVPGEEEQALEEEAPVANEQLVYTGEEQKLVNARGAWLYFLDGEHFTDALPTAVDAGKYTVYFMAVGRRSGSGAAPDGRRRQS